MSMAHKWRLIATYSVVLCIMMILTAIKYQGVNYEYTGAIRYIEPAAGQIVAEAYENIGKGTAELIKIK